MAAAAAAAALVATVKETPVLSSLVFTEVGEMIDTWRTSLLMTPALMLLQCVRNGRLFCSVGRGFPPCY